MDGLGYLIMEEDRLLGLTGAQQLSPFGICIDSALPDQSPQVLSFSLLLGRTQRVVTISGVPVYAIITG